MKTVITTLLTFLLVSITYAETASTNLSLDFQNLFPLNSTSIHDANIAKHFVHQTVFHDSIPDEFKEFISAEFIAINKSSLEKTVELKGFNKLGGKVFINGKEIILNHKGEFLTDISFTESGNNSVFILFTTIDHKILALRKQVNILLKPIGYEQLKKDRLVSTYFYNSDLLAEKETIALESEITRKQLAYFIYKIRKAKQNESDISAFNKALYVEDVVSNIPESEAIAYVLNQHIMGEYPDGLFYPTKNVSKLEVAVSLVRALKLPLTDHSRLTTFKDLSPNHWAYKFIEAAVKAQLISPTNELAPNSTVTLKDFIQMTKSLDAVQFYFNKIDEFPEEFSVEPEQMLALYAPLFAHIEAQEQLKMNTEKIQIDSPESASIVYESSITINGKIYPPTSFTFDNNIVTADMLGQFSVSKNLELGHNQFELEAFGVTANYELIYLESAQDLNEHWLKETASILAYMALIEQSSTFNAKEAITRYSFCNYLSPFVTSFSIQEALLVTTNETLPTINDIQADDKQSAFIASLVTHNILSLNELQEFSPQKPMTRIEALTAIVRLIQLDENIVSLNQNEHDYIPFWDVPKKHWGRPYLEFAFKHDMISESNHFYPKDIITKDQLIAMFSKFPWVEAAIKGQFHVKRDD